MTFKLDLTYRQRWENVSYIRHFVADMLSEEFCGLSDSKRVSTATSELVENLVKHSSNKIANISIATNTDGSEILLNATNTVSKELLEEFKVIFKEIYKSDPKTVYKEMMLRSLGEKEISQLGLARIRYECEGEISYSIESCKSKTTLCQSLPKPSKHQLLSITVKVPISDQLLNQPKQEMLQ